MCDPVGARIIDSWPLTPTPQASRTRRPLPAAAVAETISSPTHQPAVRSRSAPSGPAEFPLPPVRGPPQPPPRPPPPPPPPRSQHHHHLHDIGDARTSGRDAGRSGWLEMPGSRDTWVMTMINVDARRGRWLAGGRRSCIARRGVAAAVASAIALGAPSFALGQNYCIGHSTSWVYFTEQARHAVDLRVLQP
jgi:hypothetical protein